MHWQPACEAMQSCAPASAIIGQNYAQLDVAVGRRELEGAAVAHLLHKGPCTTSNDHTSVCGRGLPNSSLSKDMRVLVCTFMHATVQVGLEEQLEGTLPQ